MSIVTGLENVVRENEPLAPYTRLRIGGVAEFFAEPTTVDELVQLVSRFNEHQQPIRLLGGGSNILIQNEGVGGLVLHLAAPVFCKIEWEGDTIRAGGGCKLSHFVSTGVREGMAGAENLVGIPGTVGGALHENSGAHGSDVGTFVKSATVLTRRGEVVTRQRDEMNFAYRQSSLNELAILETEFTFEKEDPDVLTRRMQKLWIVKRARQPGLDQCAAYVFKDQGGESAHDLIERAGLRGTKMGGVSLCATDANFFVAEPGATSDDVARLIELVRNQVADRLAVELEVGLELW